MNILRIIGVVALAAIIISSIIAIPYRHGYTQGVTDSIEVVREVDIFKMCQSAIDEMKQLQTDLITCLQQKASRSDAI